MVKKSLMVLSLAALIVLFTASSALANVVPPPNPSSGPPGTNVTWEPCGFTANTTVACYWDVKIGSVGVRTMPVLPIATGKANGGGCVSFSFKVPDDASAGDHTLFAMDTTERTAEATFTVTEVAAEVTAQKKETHYAYTGMEILPWLMGGSILIGLGAGLRKRRR